LVTVSDKKIGVDANSDGTIDYYTADVISAQDYYPGGMTMPGRKSSQSNSNYRYGFNSIEKADEISGAGNHYTAEFGEYDPRLGRRWNLDPKPTIGVSDYSMFLNNPIYYNDIKLDTPSHKPQTGKCETCKDNTLENGDYVSDVQHQTYAVTVGNVSQKDFDKVRTTFLHDPGQITNNSWATYDLIDRDGSFGASAGDHIDIDIAGPDNGSVRIKSIAGNSTFFSPNFQALNGHPDAGEIFFYGSYDANTQSLTFTVSNITRTDVNLDAVGGNAFARFAQQRQWKVVLSNVPKIMAKPVTSAQMTIAEYDYNDWTNKVGNLEWTKTTDITNFVKDKSGQK
jgi:hypothetical protein